MSPCRCVIAPCPLCHQCPHHFCLCTLPSALPPPSLKRRRTAAPSLPRSAASCLVSSNAAAPPFAPDHDRLVAVLPHLDLDPALLAATPPADRAHLIMRTLVQSAAHLIAPANPAALAACFLPPEPGPPSTPPPHLPPHQQPSAAARHMLVANVVSAMKATKRGTLARRYVRSVLCGTMTRAEVNALLGYAEDSPDHNGSSGRASAAAMSRYSAAPRSVLHNDRDRDRGRDDDEDDDDDDDDDAYDDRDHSRSSPRRCKIPRISSKTFSRSRRDWDTLLERGELQPSKFGRARVRDDALRQLIAFLFASENVVLASWTAQRIVVHGKKLDIPALVGAKSGSALHDAYCKLLKANDKKPLSRGSFYAVANTLTRRQVGLSFPVDVTTQIFVKDPLILVRDVILRTIPYPRRSALLQQVDNMEWFLIHSYVESHLGQDTDGFHDLNFALQSDTLMGSVSDMFDRSVHCKGCLVPFALLAEIQTCAQLQRDSPDAKMMANCRLRFLLYLRLTCRKAAQDRGIEKVVDEVVSGKLYNRVIVFMNHLSYDQAVGAGKTHLIPKEKDLSIYGSLVLCLAKKQDSGARNDRDPSVTDLETRFYAHLIGNDRYSDVRVAAICIEALFHQIRLNVPHAEEVVLVSDNSPMYKNHILPALVPQLASKAGLTAVRYIYSCSQLCEFLVDEYLEHIMGIGQESLQNGEILTSQRVVEAVNSEQKYLNVAAEFISISEDFHMFSQDLENESSVIPSIGIKNDVLYEERQVADPANPGDSGSVITRLHDFSGVGTGTSFEIEDSSVRELERFLAFNRRGCPLWSRSDDAWVGPITGVDIAISARRLPLSTCSKNSLVNGVSAGAVGNILSQLRYSKMGADADEKTDSPDVGASVQGSTGKKSLTCGDCLRSFISESFQRSHSCKGSPLEKDVSARAVVVAKEMLREGALPIFKDPSEHFAPSDPVCFEGAKNWAGKILRFGWARLPLPEDILESAQQQQYKKEVFERLRKREPDQNLDPSEIRCFLRSKYEGRNDVPKEKTIRHWCLLQEATKRIEPFCMTAADGARIVPYSEDTQSIGSGRARMNPRYLAKITAMHQHSLSLVALKRPKPRHMYKEFEDFFRDGQGHLPPDFPNQKQVMNKINALRTKSKQG